MCNGNNLCEYEGEMLEAHGPKDVYLYCSFQDDGEYRIPERLTVSVCPECNEPDWSTLS